MFKIYIRKKKDKIKKRLYVSFRQIPYLNNYHSSFFKDGRVFVVCMFVREFLISSWFDIALLSCQASHRYLYMNLKVKKNIP